MLVSRVQTLPPSYSVCSELTLDQVDVLTFVVVSRMTLMSHSDRQCNEAWARRTLACHNARGPLGEPRLEFDIKTSTTLAALVVVSITTFHCAFVLSILLLGHRQLLDYLRVYPLVSPPPGNITLFTSPLMIFGVGMGGHAIRTCQQTPNYSKRVQLLQ